jgi:serine/threonine protein kinase
MTNGVTDGGRLPVVADYSDLTPLGPSSRSMVYRATAPSRLGLGPVSVGLRVITGIDDAAVRRFMRELQTFARTKSDYVVALHDAGQDGNQFFYAMEWCEVGGITPELGRETLVRAVADAARGAHALHEIGTTHRDVRPASILVRGEGRPSCLGDLGSAQQSSVSVTSMVSTSSLAFVDPRQILGDKPAPTADVYSLAATLHFVLTGHHLVDGIDTMDPVMAMRTVLKVKPMVHADSLDVALAELLQRAIDPEPEARPASALEFAQALEALT